MNYRLHKNYPLVTAFLKMHALLACLLCALYCNAQSSFIDSTSVNTKRITIEKAFLHTDRTFYLVGETVWFKAYVVDGEAHHLSELSKVLYVELLDDKNKPVQQTMIELENGLGDGSFLLPSSLNSGRYVLRAYTAWMENFDADLFFQSSLEIVNTSKKPDWNAIEKKKDYAIQFFPEGGNMVEEVPTKLGFQLVDQYGMGADGKILIIENAKDTVATFRPLRFGIGSVNFLPKAGAAYKAVAIMPDGDKITANLPQIYKRGVGMHVSDLNTGLVKITCAAPLETSTLYLFTTAHGTVKQVSAAVLKNGKTEWQLDKKNLADGINCFTVLDADKKPVCERLYFKKPLQKLNIDLSTDNGDYKTRSKVAIAINTSDVQRQSVAANLSLSVFHLDSLQSLDPNSIESYVWLSSELKGFIESPAYYFSKDDEEVNAAIDNLMLTLGWRRFKWEEINTAQDFRFEPEYEGLIIRGRVVNKSTGNPVPNVLCFLSAPGEKFYVGNAVSDENGEIRFVTKNIYGSTELIAQTDGSDANLRIDLFNSYSEKFAGNFGGSRFELAERWKEDLNHHQIAVQVSNRFSSPLSKRLFLPASYDTTAFFGKPDNRYLLDMYTRFPTMEEVVREIVQETHLQKEQDTFHFRMLNAPYHSHFDTDPLVLFDGVPIFNTNKIIAFDPLKVKQVQVVARKYFWNNTVNSGIISYSTYDGNLAGFELDPSALVVDFNGLQLKREFYSPSYSSAEEWHSREPDQRQVLLWQPYLKAVSGKAETNFYTSDLQGRYAIVVQGISENREVGSKVLFIKVKGW